MVLHAMPCMHRSKLHGMGTLRVHRGTRQAIQPDKHHSAAELDHQLGGLEGLQVEAGPQAAIELQAAIDSRH